MADPYVVHLEERLRNAGSRIELPDAPDLAERVVAGIEASRIRRVQPWWSHPGFAVAALLLLVAGAALVFSPAARDAVAGWIGLDGVKIGYDRQPDRPLGDDLLLGNASTLAEAAGTTGFEVQPPAQLGPPDEVYLARGSDPRVSLVYGARPGLPRTPTTQVGLLLSVFRAQIEHEIVTKKTLGTGTTVEPIAVDGSRGYWLSGEPHALYYISNEGELREDLGRLAGNTLVWQHGDLIYRLESRLSKARALEVARSIP